jgi:Tfp pilus assembly protein PilV
MLTPGAHHRRRWQVAAPDAGVSLIELVVAMTLMTVVGTLTLTFFITMNSADRKTVDANIATASARNALESWTRLLSLADSKQGAGSGAGRFEQITPTGAVFYANVNNRATATSARTAPTKIFLSLEAAANAADGQQLVERDYAPISSVAPSTYPVTPTHQRYLASNVVISGWLFTPYVLGSPPTISEPNDCNGAGGLCAGDLGADAILPTIVRVDISFAVQPSPGVALSFSSSAVITGGTT